MASADHVEYVAIRDSDLGVDKGMRLIVVPDSDYEDGKVDLDVPALDMRIARVRLPHPDLRLAPSLASPNVSSIASPPRSRSRARSSSKKSGTGHVAKLKDRSRRPDGSRRRVPVEYVVVRDSYDLGLDKGTRLVMIPGSRYPDGGFDADVPMLDMHIKHVRFPHPDLALRSPSKE